MLGKECKRHRSCPEVLVSSRRHVKVSAVGVESPLKRDLEGGWDVPREVRF